MTLSAPFPWFGGKSRAAAKIWEALGDVDCYVEPFGGSLATLLARPDDHRRKVETVNDADGLLINFWRAIQAEPDAVARWADWPVSEIDLTARHLWLVARRPSLSALLLADPLAYDPQAAGWWVWGACCWIGSGWCSGPGPWSLVDGVLTDGNAGRGIHRQLPHLGNAGQGIHRQLPHLGDAGRGIHRQLPHLGDAGRGIHRQLPHLGDAGRGIADWFDQIATRLRGVRICAGDFRRVLTPAVVERHGTAGVLLDPPYPEGWDADAAYAGQTEAAADICADVFEAAIDLGARGVRVVVCGYSGTWTPPPGWTARAWTARKGYSAGKAHHREVLWCSPACLPETQAGLFGGAP